MAKWKYKVVTRRVRDISASALNTAGNSGWELVFMTQLWNGKVLAVFKKQVV
jgi:hypothetical protein